MSTTKEAVRQAYVAHRRAHGQDAALRIVKNVTGSEELDRADEAQRQRLLELFEGEGEVEGEAPFGAPADFSNADGTVNVGAVYAKWNRKRG